MKVMPMYSATGLEQKWLIEIGESDIGISKDPAVDVWRMLDKIGEHFKVPPLCPCGERPHRIHCPLGFDNYFRPYENEFEPQSGEKL